MEHTNLTVDSFKDLKSHKIIVLLVDDQFIISEAIRRMLEDQEDIVFHYCQDPAKAIQTAEKIKPTVILQDLVMPEIEGLLLVRYYRANKATKDVPIVVLSSKEEATIKAKAFALGANDYMVKFPNKLEVLARIRYHSKGYINLLERNDAYVKITESQDLLVQQLNEAADYAFSLFPDPLKGDIESLWRFIPCDALGGDSFGYHWIDEDNFAIYLLDVCGHGVGAALLSISAINVLRSKSSLDTDFTNPGQVLQSLNKTFPMEKNNMMFFTIWYGVYNKKTRIIKFSSGGHPPGILIHGPDKDNLKVETLTTPGLVIGGMPDMEYPTDECKIDVCNTLYVYSDGVYEISKVSDGLILELDDFVKDVVALKDPNVVGVDRILNYARETQGKDGFADDFSIMQFTFS